MLTAEELQIIKSGVHEKKRIDGIVINIILLRE
jgi:hypothetical protein